MIVYNNFNLLNFSMYILKKKSVFYKIFNKNLLFFSTKSSWKPRGKKVVTDYVRDFPRRVLINIINYNYFINSKFTRINVNPKLFFFKKLLNTSIMSTNFHRQQQVCEYKKNKLIFSKIYLKPFLNKRLNSKFNLYQLLLSFNLKKLFFIRKINTNIKFSKKKYNKYIFNKFFYKFFKKKIFLRQPKSVFKKKKSLVYFFLKNLKIHHSFEVKIRSYNTKLRYSFPKLRKFKILKKTLLKPMLGMYFPYLNFTYLGAQTNLFKFNFPKKLSYGFLKIFSKFSLSKIGYLSDWINLSNYTNRWKIVTSHGASFILYTQGLFLPSTFHYKFLELPLYIIKKKFYSFLRNNEFKMSILNSRKKFIINKLFYENKNTNIFNYNLFNTSMTTYNYFNCNFNKNTVNFKDLIYKKSNITLNNINMFNYKEYNIEIRVPRIKFNPGYQRLWRQFRLALSELINFKYKYQQQITKHIMKFSRKIHQNYFSENENNVLNILSYSGLISDKSTFTLFIKNKLVYLNGLVLQNKSIYIYKNDFIQVEISNWYYIFSRWSLNVTRARNVKFKNLIYKKSAASKYKIMKQRKQKSHYTPNWIKNVRFDFTDVKPFLEVDFFTLSVFIIYDYNFITYYTPDDINTTRYNLYRIYNWKYIV